MEIMTRRLKPCPFCGREVVRCSVASSGTIVHRLVVECCGTHDIDVSNMILYGSDGNIYIDEDAVDIWNHRGDA